MAVRLQTRLALETDLRARAEPGVPRDPEFDIAGLASTSYVDAGDATTLAAANAYSDGKVIDSIADADTTHAPSRNAVYDALAGKEAAGAAATAQAAAQAFATAADAALLTGTITNGDTTHAPTGNAVFDALALKQDTIPTTGATGTADALIATFSPALTAYTDGQFARVRPGFDNATTTPTMNANGLGALTIKKNGGAALAVGDIQAIRDMLVSVYDDGFTQWWELLNPASTGSGSTPTGTGFRHVTSGVEDGAAKLVDTADINADQVTNAKLANMAAHTIKANITGGSADPVDSSLSAILDAELGNTRGQIIRRGSAAWEALGLGTTGQAVISDGTDALWGSVGAAAGGGYTRLGASTVAGSAATTITVSGLNLSAYKAFKVYFALKDAAAGATGIISLFYNSDVTATDYNEQALTLNGTSLTAARANDARMGNLDASRYVTGFIEIETDVNARASALIFSNRDNSSGIVWQSAMHVWTTNFANVTGITISSSIANQLAIGSTFIVYGITS